MVYRLRRKPQALGLGDHFGWATLWPPLQGFGYHVLALDLRGHGASRELAPEKYEMLVRRDATHPDVRLGPLTLSLPHHGLPDGECEVAIRPETIELGPGGGPLAATVERAAYLGPIMEYTLATAIGELFAISTAVAAPLAPGAVVGVALATHGVVVIPVAATR